ncbi:MAG TPA: ABC transporter ATP-binding protein [Planctomycetota bacterium]|nr:ABC transporter ATP-binding protein [Planctomycetota bacterium]
MKAIEVIGLAKRYGTTQALAPLSFDIGPGEAVGLLGPNGSGKTTLLRMLATLLKPTAGYARVMDLDGRFQAPKIRRLLGFMPDVAGLEEDLSVGEYLDFYSALNGQSGPERTARVQGLLDLLDLGPVRDRATGALSRGMQQRVGLARTLVHDPAILLLDEPAANLDPRSRLEILAVLRELRKMGKTIIISSHILPELEDLCTRMVILQQGRLAFEGSLAEAARQFSTSRRFELRVDGDGARLREALASEPTVASVGGAGGTLEVTLKPGDHPVGFLARRAVELGLTVTGLREEVPGLEELFLQLTKGKIEP